MQWYYQNLGSLALVGEYNEDTRFAILSIISEHKSKIVKSKHIANDSEGAIVDDLKTLFSHHINKILSKDTDELHRFFNTLRD